MREETVAQRARERYTLERLSYGVDMQHEVSAHEEMPHAR